MDAARPLAATRYPVAPPETGDLQPGQADCRVPMHRLVAAKPVTTAIGSDPFRFNHAERISGALAMVDRVEWRVIPVSGCL
jgi:hypothetical protein